MSEPESRPLTEAEYRELLPLQMLSLAHDFTHRLLPPEAVADGMHLVFSDPDDGRVRDRLMDGIVDREDSAFARDLRKMACDAFGVAPWQAGLAHVLWRLRIWRRVTLARWRVARRIEHEEQARDRWRAAWRGERP